MEKTKTKAEEQRFSEDCISELQRTGNWRVIKYRARHAHGKMAMAASDALLRAERSVALSKVVSYRLRDLSSKNPEGTDKALEHIFRNILNSGDVHPTYMILFHFILDNPVESKLGDKLYLMLRDNGNLKHSNLKLT